MVTVLTKLDMKFNTFIPFDIAKSVSTGVDSDYFIIKGLASTPSLDVQNDIVNPKGIDIEYFMQSGYINYEHESDKVIGFPTENCYVDENLGLFVEAKLFKDNPYAREMIELAERLEKSGTGRKLGFSIEGNVKQRNVNDSRIIEGVMITGMAVTKRPANTDSSWDVIMKSFVTGEGITPDTQVDAGALRREALASSITKLTYATKLRNVSTRDDLWAGVLEMLKKSDGLGYEESVITLQLARGLSRKDAELAVMEIKRKYLEKE